MVKWLKTHKRESQFRSYKQIDIYSIYEILNKINKLYYKIA
jgi:hypothetical protein